MIASLQAQLLFPVEMVGRPDPLPPGARQLSIPSAEDDLLQGVHIPPSRPGDGILVIGFGGNAWNGSDVAAYLHHIYPQADVVAFHYRGYRPSAGRPSARALLADAPIVFDHAIGTVRPKGVVAVGFSIGSGVAASLAKDRKLDGLVLVTPFDSLKAAAADLYPWLPIAAFFEHEIDAAAFLEGNQVPVAIIGGERDSVISPARTDALRRQVPNLAYDRTIENAGHNDIYERSEFHQAMREALSTLTK